MRALKNAASAAALVVALGFAGAASAATVELTNITGSWININPNSIVASDNGTDNPTMSWGIPAVTNGSQSGYTFQASPDTSVMVPPDQEFDLGTFAHLNNPIFAPSLISATLQVDLQVAVDGNPAELLSFLFDFTHNETDNAANPCANGDANGVGVNINGCADLVTVTNSVFSDTFLVDGVLYTLAIAGFEVGGVTVSTFETIEQAINEAVLVAKITSEIPEIPVPAALPLFLAGLAGFGFATRKRPQAA